MGTELQTLARWLILGGLGICAIGALMWLLGRFGLTRLPGDIVVRRENFTFYAPIGLMLLLSVVLTVVLNLFARRGR